MTAKDLDAVADPLPTIEDPGPSQTPAPSASTLELPDELRVVHFELDPVRTEDLSAARRNLGLSRVSLEIIECQDRCPARAAAELVAGITSDGETEVSVLVPRRQYTHFLAGGRSPV